MRGDGEDHPDYDEDEEEKRRERGGEKRNNCGLVKEHAYAINKVNSTLKGGFAYRNIRLNNLKLKFTHIISLV